MSMEYAARGRSMLARSIKHKNKSHTDGKDRACTKDDEAKVLVVYQYTDQQFRQSAIEKYDAPLFER